MRTTLWIAMVLMISAGQPGLKGQTRVDMARQGKNVDFASADKTRPFKVGSSLPAQCEPGEVFFKTNEMPSQAVYVCGPENSWQAVGRELPTGDMTPGKVLVVGESGVQWRSPGGDIGGTIENLTVRGLQGRAVSSATPSEGDVLRWSAVTGMWEARAPEGQYDPGAGVLIAGRSISVDAATVPSYSTGIGAPTGNCHAGGDYYVDLAAQRLYFCGAGSSWRAVASAGDAVSWGSITGDLSAQGDLWSALNQKADRSHSHSLGGDVTGDVTAATVVRLQGRAVSSEAPNDGQALVWSAAESKWKPSTVGGAGGSFNALDETVLWYRENFPNKATTSNSIGTYGWELSCSTGTVSHVGTGNGSKAVRLSSAATSGSYCAILLGSVGTTGTVVGAIGSYAGWDSIFRFRLYTTSNVRMFVGYLKGSMYDPWANAHIGLSFDTTAGDTQFVFSTYNGTNGTRIASGVAVDTNWHKLRIRSTTSGTIVFNLDDGTDVSINTNVATTTAMAPAFYINTQEAVAKTIDVLRWYWSGPDVR